MSNHLIIYLFSFIGIWTGAGLAVGSVEKLSHKLKISSFAVSFILLGFFTSISEMSVGINSVIENDPEIYVGNLIGASIVLFLLIIPLLAVIGKSIKVRSELRGHNLILSLIVVALPVFLSIDGAVTKIDGIISIISYITLVFSIQLRQAMFEKVKKLFAKNHIQIEKELIKIILGIVLVFISSHFVVVETEYFAKFLNVKPFLISLLVISIGTNIPELSLMFRSFSLKDNEIAFGDYVGSASFNTFIFGGLSLFYGKSVYLTNSYLVSLSFLIIGLIGFYIFARSKNTITRFEALGLLMLYLIFVLTEVLIHK